jgi:hypothetical protein
VCTFQGKTLDSIIIQSADVRFNNHWCHHSHEFHGPAGETCKAWIDRTGARMRVVAKAAGMVTTLLACTTLYDARTPDHKHVLPCVLLLLLLLLQAAAGCCMC